MPSMRCNSASACAIALGLELQIRQARSAAARGPGDSRRARIPAASARAGRTAAPAGRRRPWPRPRPGCAADRSAPADRCRARSRRPRARGARRSQRLGNRWPPWLVRISGRSAAARRIGPPRPPAPAVPARTRAPRWPGARAHRDYVARASGRCRCGSSFAALLHCGTRVGPCGVCEIFPGRIIVSSVPARSRIQLYRNFRRSAALRKSPRDRARIQS